MKINKEILIEDLIEILPESIEYLRVKGIRCIRCGEPIWGTVEAACKEKDFPADKIEEITTELNDLYKDKASQPNQKEIRTIKTDKYQVSDDE